MILLDSIKTAFQIAELNDLKVMAADVGNAYLHGFTREKIYTIAGTKFGELQSRILVFFEFLYNEIKTSLGRWHEVLSETL